MAQTIDTPRTPATPANPLLGTTLAERFRLEERIGSGGMSTVYRASDEALGRVVAIKLFRRDAADASDLRREREEIRTIATLSHPAIVTLFDAVADSDAAAPDAFLVMQYVDGENLADRLRRGPLEEGQPALVGAAIADALAYVHARGIIHRDVKPGNILLPGADSTGPVAMLTDFGIARIVDGSRLTATDTVIGTAGYLSPEQARGGPLGSASDIYSLGLVLLECLTGVRAYPGPAVESALARLSNDPDIPDSVPQTWRTLLRAMTARDAADRPSAVEVATELAASRIDEPTERLPAAASEPVVAPDIDVPTVTLPMRSAMRDEELPPTTVLPTAAITEESDDTPPSGTRRPAIIIASGFAAVVVSAVIAIGLLQPTAPAVDYPAVDGDLGIHLEQLQESVDP